MGGGFLGPVKDEAVDFNSDREGAIPGPVARLKDLKVHAFRIDVEQVHAAIPEVRGEDVRQRLGSHHLFIDRVKRSPLSGLKRNHPRIGAVYRWMVEPHVFPFDGRVSDEARDVDIVRPGPVKPSDGIRIGIDIYSRPAVLGVKERRVRVLPRVEGTDIHISPRSEPSVHLDNRLNGEVLAELAIADSVL